MINSKNMQRNDSAIWNQSLLILPTLRRQISIIFNEMWIRNKYGSN